jgi:hypothetical protein
MQEKSHAWQPGCDICHTLLCLLAPAVTTSFAVAKAANKTEAIVTATATASSRVAKKNRQAAANTFAATATAAVDQGVVEVFARSQVCTSQCNCMFAFHTMQGVFSSAKVVCR